MSETIDYSYAGEKSIFSPNDFDDNTASEDKGVPPKKNEQEDEEAIIEQEENNAYSYAGEKSIFSPNDFEEGEDDPKVFSLEEDTQPAFEYGTPIEAAEADDDKVLTLEQLSQDETFMNKVETYYTKRTKQGAREEDESNEDYLERFMSNHYRAFLYRDVHLADQIYHLKTSSEDEKRLFGDIFNTIEKHAPSVFDDEMGTLDAAKAVGDTILYSATSVSTLGTILFSGAVGTLAGPVGTGAGVAAGVTAVKVASTAAIRSALLSNIGKTAAKAAISKPVVKATVASAAMSTVDDLMLQNVERLGYIDPSTMKYDPTASREDLELSLGRAAISGATGGILQGVPVGAGAYLKLRKFNQKRADNMEAIKEAQKKYQKTLEATDSVTSTPSGGALDLETIQLAEAIDKARKAYNKKAKEPLMKAVKEEFVFIDNIKKEDYDKAIDALQNADVFENIGKVSIQLQKDLDKIGMLDVLGEKAAATYRGIKGDKGAPPTRVTAVIADGLDGIENLFSGSYAKELSRADEKAVLAVLDEALIKGGISKKEFVTYMSFYTNGAISVGDMTRKSMSTAAKTMARASKLKKEFFNEVYPNTSDSMRKIMDGYMEVNGNNKYQKALDNTVTGIKTFDRVRTSSLTSQLVTTARNVMSGGTMVVAQTGVNIVDSLLYHTGRGLVGLKEGNIDGAAIGRGMMDIMAESSSVIMAVLNTTKSQTLIDATMEFTPDLHKTLIRSQPDLMDASKGKFTKYANNYIETLNHFNIASDSFYRRAFYMSALDKRFKNYLRDHKAKYGSALSIPATKDTKKVEIKSLMQFIESGRILDKRLITGATQDALKMTFAATPENAMAKNFLNGLEKWRPLTTVVMPFPRFFVNAIRTTYEFSPLNPAVKMTRALAGDKYTGAQYRESVAQGLIGTAGFAYAYKHLSNKEDGTPWYDVMGVDIRAMWPVSAYFAAVELLIALDQRLESGVLEEKVNRKRNSTDIKMAVETLSGFPVRSGENVNRVFGALVDIFKDADSVGNQSINDRLTEFTAEYLGGFGTPLRMIKDVSEQLSVDSRRKDIRAGLEDDSSMTQISSRMAASNLPENIFGLDVQERMPIRQYMYEDAEKNRRSPIARFVGVTFTPKSGAVEREVARVGLKRKDLLPYTGSSRLNNLQTKHYRLTAIEGLSNLINSNRYNSDVDIKTGEPMTVREKLIQQSNMIKSRAKSYREVAKASAAEADNQEADEKTTALMIKIDKMQKENATKEELAEAMGELAAYSLYHISNDRQKVLWDSKASSTKASIVEKEFARRHEEAKRKRDKGDILYNIDYMYLRGPTIAEQKSYGLATVYLESYDESIDEAAQSRAGLGQ